MLAREPLELLQVARRVLGGEQAVELGEPPDHAVELGARRGFTSGGLAASSVSVAAYACVGP